MNFFRRGVIYLVVLLSIVACSTTRKSAVETETLTQTFLSVADSCSHHVQTISKDSTKRDSWEEIVVEWDRHDSIYTDEPQTELQQLFNDLRKAGASRAILRKGESTVNVSSVEKDSTASRRQLSEAATNNHSKEKKTKEKTRKPDWAYVLIYILVMTLLVSIILIVNRIVNKK